MRILRKWPRIIKWYDLTLTSHILIYLNVFTILIHLFIGLGRSKDNGQGLGEDETPREKIHVDEGQYPSSVDENTNASFAKRYGGGDEGGY